MGIPPETKYEKVREEIAKVIYNSRPFISNFMTGEIEAWEVSKPCLREADQILSLPDIYLKDDDQELPENKYTSLPQEGNDRGFYGDPIESIAYLEAQQDMLTNNWVKVLKK